MLFADFSLTAAHLRPAKAGREQPIVRHFDPQIRAAAIVIVVGLKDDAGNHLVGPREARVEPRLRVVGAVSDRDGDQVLEVGRAACGAKSICRRDKNTMRTRFSHF
jgi:hypothetical protein